MKARTLLALVGGVALSISMAMAETPDKFVRYVEATGSQYVDTGIVGRYGTKAECKVEWMELGDKAFLDCGDWSNNTRFFMCHCSSASGNMFLGYRTGVKVHKTYDDLKTYDLLFETKRVYTYTTDISAPDGDDNTTATITIDGTTADSVVAKSLNTEQNLYIFAMNHNGSPYGYSKTRCYGLKIWQDGSLVRDFRPCVHDGHAGLYDAQNDRIYYSASGTDLTYDENCDVPDAFIDYVESFGNSYVDTGITGESGTSAKMEIALMGNSDQALLASRNGNDRFYLIHNGGGSQWLYGYGGYSKFGTFTVGTKYYVDSSLAVGSQVIKIGEDGPDGATTTYIDAANTTPIDTGRSMYVFCCNQSGSALAKQYWGKARIYWLQIFQDGEMVRDFRPCLKYGEAALYDDVSKRIFYPEGDPLGYDNSVAANADEVVYVDYIEADGFTHLDTQVAASSPTRATGTFSWTQMRTTTEEAKYLDDSHHSYLACGCYNSSSDANRFYMIDQTSQKPWIGYGNNAKSFGSAMATGTKYAFDVSFAAGTQTASLVPEGGSDIGTTASWSGAASGQGNLYLFACNDAKNKKPIYRSAARCYGLTIYQGGETPVRNFRPCIKDRQAALYDTVSGRIFYPVPAIPAEGNTGEIKEESVLSPVDAYLEYVETDGTQYVDTGVVGKDGTSAEFIEVSRCASSSGAECFLGAKGSDASSRFFMWYHRNNFALGLGYAGEFWTPSIKDPTAKVSDWNPATNPDSYGLPNGRTNHVRVAFSDGSQRVVAVNDATGTQSIVANRAIAGGVNTAQNLYVFAYNNNGTPTDFGKSRLYWMKLRQDGRYMRRFQPARLKNGLVGLWDHVEEKIHLPKTSTGAITYFSAVGTETESMSLAPLVIIIK